MFSGVGSRILILCSCCCLLKFCLIVGVHHGCFRDFGIFSCFSTICWMVFCMFSKRWSFSGVSLFFPFYWVGCF